MKRVKIFGARRSGTNCIKKLLEDNYEVNVLGGLEGGWKHGGYRVKQKLGYEVDCVVISKNIFSWLSSIHRRYSGWAWYEILETRDLIEVYNLLYDNWLRIPKILSDKKCVFVKYRNLVMAPEKQCQRVAERLKIKCTQKKFENIDNVIEPSGEVIPKAFDRTYYSDRLYMEDFSEDDIDKIKEYIDLDVVKKLKHPVGLLK